MDEDALRTIDDELRAIRLDDGPKLVPLRLDKMFLRARQWRPPTTNGASSSSTAMNDRNVQVERPPTPPRSTIIYPLPLPLPANTKEVTISPLWKLFQYPELVPSVLEHFDQPKDLAIVARVCKDWCRIARKRLYEYIWVRPWEDGCHFKLVLLMDTLHKNPELCELVHKLDVRFFPLAARGNERSELDDQVQQAISHMYNLRSLVWTRDRSINPSLLEKVSDLDHLRSLEITGHSYRYYDPALLGCMPALEDLRIMMPDPNLKSKLVDAVKELDKRRCGGLRGLGIICQSSPLIDDAILKVMAPHLKALRRLTLWGCSRVTRDGVFTILDEAGDNVEELSLDALPHSRLLDLSLAPRLPRLSTLSLTITIPHPDPANPIALPSDLPTLPTLPSLTSFHLTLSAAHYFLPLSTYVALQSQLFTPSMVRKLSLINLVIAQETLTYIIQSNPSLEELYVSVNGRSTILNCEALENCKLRIFHVNAPTQWSPTSEDLRSLAEKMKWLDQIGAGNRVYEVHRKLDGDDDEVKVELCRWGRTTIPGYFQVWRA
ncbi:hypothetical protein CI109_105227 [Kwoniella shandongensis]|uniref:Uncharacterized protein n=1 Tax=Kwoniella shandongensis TaxID=1734106 RepID=A0A5M6C3L2_9TREE|nr:uncharacterized protein CI109_002069 [Kwoniella shandongensis]KAA5529644.1 hypothetical protein CI109_002069 [Kwoniella shandongensis]